MKLEDKISEAFNEYEIKTTSRDILTKMPQKEEKKRINPVFLKLGLSFAVLVLAFAPLLSKVLDNDKLYIENNSTNLNESKVISRAALELYYCGMLSENNTYLATTLDEAKDKYNKINDLVNNIYLKHTEGLVSYYEEETFKYDNIKYKYKLTVSDYTLYTKKDITENDYDDKIAICFDDTCYSGEMEIEKERDEVEVSISYYKDNKIISIEKEVEQEDNESELELSYLIRDRNTRKTIVKESFEIESENNKMILEFSFESESEDYEMIIINKQNINEITYINHKTNKRIELIYDKNNKNFIEN